MPNNTIKNIRIFFERWHVVILMSACLIPVLFSAFAVHDISKLPSLNYYIGYETGFGGRKLIGTLLHTFLPEYIRHRHILPFVFGANVILAILFAKFVYMAMPKISKQTLPTLMVILVYFISPFSILNFFSTNISIWFMETYMLILVLLWLIVYIKWRDAYRGWYYVVTGLVAVTCMLIHHTFACEFFPLFLALFLYDVLGDKITSWKKIVAYLTICTIVAGVFLSIWFYSTMNIDFETLHTDICRRTALGVCDHSEWSLYAAYYLKGKPPIPQDIHISFLFFSALLLMSPITIFFVCPWINAAKASETKRGKYRYILCALVESIVTLPIFFILYDHARWWYCWFFCQFALIMVTVCMKDETIINQLRHMALLLKRHWLFTAVFAIYTLLALHPYNWLGLLESIRLRDLLW